MKALSFFLLVIPFIGFCQDLKYDYSINKNNLEFVVDSDTIKYDYKKDQSTFGNSVMENEIFSFSTNENYGFKRDEIVINQKVYIFKRPMLSKRTTLVDKTSNKELLHFDANYQQHNFTFEINDNFNKMIDESDKELLKKWAFMKQAQYIHYNARDLGDEFIYGVLVGALVNAL